MAAGRARGSRPRRVSLPGVAELFRPVGPGLASDSGRQASGREAHSQKITVYLSADELLDLERVRLILRARGIGVDRGRLVREAIAVLIADLEAGIDVSVFARRLRAVAQPDAANGTLANGDVANSDTADGALADGAAAGVLADGAPVMGALVHGVPASAGGVPVDDAAVSGTPVRGVLAHDAPVVADGVPVNGAAGPQ